MSLEFFILALFDFQVILQNESLGCFLNSYFGCPLIFRSFRLAVLITAVSSVCRQMLHGRVSSFFLRNHGTFPLARIIWSEGKRTTALGSETVEQIKSGFYSIDDKPVLK